MFAVVRAGLPRLVAPSSPSAVWNGPFEQLAGAAYALSAAEKHGLLRRSRRGYHDRVRRALPHGLLQYFATAKADAAIGDWLPGFYFNAAKQRLVWSGERLLRAFAAVPCRDGDLPPQCTKDRPLRREIIAAAQLCVDHAAATHKPGLPKTAAAVEAHQLGAPLEQLNDDVNARKHSLYPDAIISSLAQKPEREQVRLACETFVVLLDSYLELTSWSPSATRP